MSDDRRAHSHAAWVRHDAAVASGRLIRVDITCQLCGATKGEAHR